MGDGVRVGGICRIAVAAGVGEGVSVAVGARVVTATFSATATSGTGVVLGSTGCDSLEQAIEQANESTPVTQIVAINRFALLLITLTSITTTYVSRHRFLVEFRRVIRLGRVPRTAGGEVLRRDGNA